MLRGWNDRLFSLVPKGGSAFCRTRHLGWRRGDHGYRRHLIFSRIAVMAANHWHYVRHHRFVFATQIESVSEAAKLRGSPGIPRIVSISVMMCEPFFGLLFCYFLLLGNGRLYLN